MPAIHRSSFQITDAYLRVCLRLQVDDLSLKRIKAFESKRVLFSSLDLPK